MKNLIRNSKITRDQGTLGLVLGVLVTVAIAIFQSVGWERLLPLIAVAIFALIFISITSNAEDRIIREVQCRLPQISYIETRAEVDLAMQQLALSASEFLVATGGKSKNSEYLRAIEEKVKKSDILYWRILYENEITDELNTHLRKVISLKNTKIVKVRDNPYGYMTVTDSGVIIALPIPGHGELSAIQIPSSDHAKKIYISYMMAVFTKSQIIDSPEKLDNFFSG